MTKKKLIYTCSMCAHFEPNRSICNLDEQDRVSFSTQHAQVCNQKGKFVRYMHVLPDAYNYYTLEEEIPDDWEYDYRHIPKDKDGVPLVVRTKRGLEKALPANDSIVLNKSDVFFGVSRILTFQGQREAIYDLGIEMARREAEEHGVELTVLPDEEESNRSTIMV